MEKIEQILFHIERSQNAYNLYVKEKRYYQALRIFKANEQIYSLLTDAAEMWRDDETKQVILQYIFHLEDWFEQFKTLERSRPELTDEFIFQRLEGSPAYPKQITEKLKDLTK